MHSNLQHTLTVTFIIQNTINLQVWIKNRILTIPSPPKYNPNPSPKTPRKNPKQRAKFEIKIIHKKLIFLVFPNINQRYDIKNKWFEVNLCYKMEVNPKSTKTNWKIGGLLFFISLFHINNEVQLLLLRMGMFNKLNIRATLKIIETWMVFLNQKKKYCINLYRKFSNFEYFIILL